MKIAILSDIHGNLPALEAVTADIERWQPDQVLVNGDIVNRGPRSAACWEFVHARGWPSTMGNHEEYILEHLAAETPPDVTQVFYMSYWTTHQFPQGGDAVAALPEQLSRTAPDGSELRLRHGSMRRNTENVLPETPDETLAAQIAPAPAVYAAAHAHVAFVRPLRRSLVLNSGSVGTPMDGDIRASYAQVTWENGRWHADIVRVPYDRGQMLADLQDSGFLDEAGPVAWIVYHEWRLADKLLTHWRAAYERPVRSAALSLADSIRSFLEERGLHFGKNGRLQLTD